MVTRTPLLLRQLRFALRVLAALSLTALLVLVWRARHRPTREFDLEADAAFWARAGFVEMVPPLRLPGRASLDLETHVWLRLPDHSELRTTRDARSGRPLLHYPEGAEAVRVEVSHGTRVADARGARFLAGEARELYVLRPRATASPTALRGFAWLLGDAFAQSEATRALVDFARAGAGAGQADLAAASIRAQNACAQCHVPARADAIFEGEFGVVARGTDGAGLFQIQTVLADHAPMESYAPREENSADPNVEVRCGDAHAALENTRLGRLFRCPNGSVPVGYLNVSRGVQMREARVIALCRARRYLYEHLDRPGREAFGEAFRVCGI